MCGHHDYQYTKYGVCKYTEIVRTVTMQLVTSGKLFVLAQFLNRIM